MIAVPISENSTGQSFINKAYVSYLVGAGFVPFLVTPEMRTEEISAVCEGLLLPGGVDIDPSYYYEENVASFSVSPEKDQFERNLFYEFLKNKKPVFGICRGFQLIVREYLISDEVASKHLYYAQHLSDHNQVDSLKANRNVRTHTIVTIPHLLYNTGDVRSRPTTLFVNSMHHQGVMMTSAFSEKSGVDDFLGKPVRGYTVLATSYRGLRPSKDGTYEEAVCEAISVRSMHNIPETRILGVQWHPEELQDYALLSNFFRNRNQKPGESSV